MVERPPVVVVVDRMTVDDLPEVQQIEKLSFAVPWPAHAYRHELETNKMAHYLVARYLDRVVGFCGLWIMLDEAHITTFATHPDWRRQGIGERMLLAALDLSASRGAVEGTLEVRPSLVGAQRLYSKFGFKVVGVRPRYYSDNNEDALIMTTEPLDGLAMRARMLLLRDEIANRPDIELGPDGVPLPPKGPNHSAGANASSANASSADPRGSDPRDPGLRGEDARVIRPSRITRKTL